MKTAAHPSPGIADLQRAQGERDRVPLPEPSASFTGVLVDDAQVRARPCDTEGHMVPVLCLTIELDNPHHNRMRVEQPFPALHQSACEAAALRYRKGVRITIDAPLASLCMVARETSHIHVHHTEKA